MVLVLSSWSQSVQSVLRRNSHRSLEEEATHHHHHHNAKISYAPNVLHVSRHIGCIRDFYSVSEYLGWNSSFVLYTGPYTITKDFANEEWEKNKGE